LISYLQSITAGGAVGRAGDIWSTNVVRETRRIIFFLIEKYEE
jgi:hypothetical protein